MVEIEAETRRVHEYAGAWTDYQAGASGRAPSMSAYAQSSSVAVRSSNCWVSGDRSTGARPARKLARQTGGSDRRATNALRSKVAQARRQLEQVEQVDKPWSPCGLQLSFARPPSAGAIAALHGAVVELGGFRLGPIDLELRFGDRVAVVGPNGSGKTTLLRAVAGELPLASGNRSAGRATVFGQLEQGRSRFTGILLADFAEQSALPPAAARTLLAKFALGADDVTRPATTLSPGERTRATLALFAARGVNCLLLDEPTNHLDLEAIEELERALETYEGALVVVSHDRRFLDRLATDRTIALGADAPPSAMVRLIASRSRKRRSW